MLTLSSSLPQARFRPGEAVPLTLELRNRNGSPLLANARMALNNQFSPKPFREITLRVTREGGEPLTFDARVNIGAPRERDFRLLEPGEPVEKSYNLLNYFALTPGRYSVQATYQNAQAYARDGDNAWTGEVTAEPLTFEVLPA